MTSVNGHSLQVVFRFKRSIVDSNWSTVDVSPGARVTRGMAYLRDAYPVARDVIKTSCLDMYSPDLCPLGQLWGDIYAAPEYQVYGIDFLIAHGFRVIEGTPGERDQDRAVLIDLWRVAIWAWRTEHEQQGR